MRLTDPERARLNAAMDAYADGDDGAFAAVYDLLAPRLVAYFARHGAAAHEDLVHDTLLNVHRARRNYATGSDVLPWVFCIARRVLIDAYKKSRREQQYRASEDEAHAAEGRPDRSSGPDGFAMAGDAARVMNAAMGRLPESLRAAWALHLEGLGAPEVAATLGISQNAAEIRLCRVREVLRRAIDGEKTAVAPRRPAEGVCRPLETA
jgi:RNA polymerase sigma-70 factor (ECF subfamily)